MNYTALGNRITTLRQQKQLTLKKLAEQIWVSTDVMAHIENGTYVASLENLVAICNALEVTPEYLLCDSLVATACVPTGQDVAQLRQQLQGAIELVDRLGNGSTISRAENAYLGITLEALDVTYRTYSKLKHAGLNSVADLLNLMRTDLLAFLNIRGIGKKSVAEVLCKLKNMGIDVDDLIGRLDAK